MKAQKKSTHQKEPRFEDFEKEYVIEFSIESDSTSSEKLSPKVQKKIKIEKQSKKEKNKAKKIDQETTQVEKIPQLTKQKSEPKEKSALQSEEEETYQVEKIIDQKKQGKKTFYRVKWEGYLEEEATWEPEQNLINDGCQKHIEEFLNPKKVQDQPDPTKYMKLTDRKQKEPNPQKQPTPLKQPTPQKQTSSQEDPNTEKEESLSMEQVESSEKQSSLEKETTPGPTIEKVLNIRKSEGGLEFKIQYSDETECWMDSKIPKSICPQKVFEFYESKMKFINK